MLIVTVLLACSPHCAPLCANRFPRFSAFRILPAHVFLPSFRLFPDLPRHFRSCVFSFKGVFPHLASLSALFRLKIRSSPPLRYSFLYYPILPLPHSPGKIIFFLKSTLHLKKVVLYYIGIKKGHLPVAQLDSASDSDSEGRRFESCRVGHNRDPPPREGDLCYRLFVRFEPAVLLPRRGNNTKLSPSYPFVLFSLSGESWQVAPTARRIPL